MPRIIYYKDEAISRNANVRCSSSNVRRLHHLTGRGRSWPSESPYSCYREELVLLCYNHSKDVADKSTAKFICPATFVHAYKLGCAHGSQIDGLRVTAAKNKNMRKESVVLWTGDANRSTF